MLRSVLHPLAAGALAGLAALAGAAFGQSFGGGAGFLPGGPANSGYTENVDFADVDLDGDPDCLLAEGGESGSQRNRLWINQGGLQGGQVGYFVDETGARMPVTKDSSRDVDFADIDGDGDPDVYVANTSHVSNQTSRVLVNQGGLQGGSPGFFVDETASRMAGIGSAGSSVATTLVLPSGGFVDWSCDALFADLDGNGALDLVQASYGALSNGKAPTRVFLNDGAGYFREFNPSGYQLSGPDISNGEPGLWCEGLHQQNTGEWNGIECDVALDSIAFEAGDLDGDFDLDLVGGEKTKRPRVYRNRLEEAGGLVFRDESHLMMPANWAAGVGNYDQELGDLDDDGDLDLYGVNWNKINDVTHRNQGDGTFAAGLNAVGSERMNEADFIDYDGDGDIDVFVVGNNHEHEVMENPGAAGGWVFACVSGAVPDPGATPSHGGDACDVDLDGDQDYLAACRDFLPSVLYVNTTQVADAFAPRVPRVELAPNRAAGAEPTVLRAHVYDNSAWYATARIPVWLEYRVDGGPIHTVPMPWAGGQVFRGELPGELLGLISYRVLARDAVGNLGASTAQSYVASTCGGGAASYCTAGVSASGCAPGLMALGVPSPGQPSGFTVTATPVDPGRPGTFFYGFNGPAASPWGNSSSYRCVSPPLIRVGLQISLAGPAPCSSSMSRDLNAFWQGAAPGKLPAPGQVVHLQLWLRDPANTSNQSTVLSDGLAFTACP